MYLLTNSSSAISIRKVDNFNIERINCRVSSQFSKLAPNVATSIIVIFIFLVELVTSDNQLSILKSKLDICYILCPTKY